MTPSPNQVSEDEVRTMLLDRGAADNDYLRKAEIGSDLIRLGARDCVDWFNDLAPIDIRASEDDFPLRSAMKLYICGFVLRSLAINYERNNPRIQGQKTQVNDKDKFGAYMQAGAAMLEEAKDLMRRTKIQMNVRSAFGVIGRGVRR